MYFAANLPNLFRSPINLFNFHIYLNFTVKVIIILIIFMTFLSSLNDI